MKSIFTTLLLFLVYCVALTSHPLLAEATTITAVFSSDQPRYREAHQSFVKALAANGYQTPTTEILLYSPNPAPLSWSSDIRKLLNNKPDLLITYGAPAAYAAAKENSTVPVISADVFAPEQPPKGVCGVSSRVSMVTLLKTLHKVRSYQRLGVLYSPREPGSQHQLDDIRKNAAKLGITIFESSIASVSQLESEFPKLLDKCEAVVVTEGEILGQQFDRIVAKAKSRRIPVAATMPDAAERGAVVSLEINPHDQGYLAAEMAVRVLEGARTEFLPLVRPQRVDLVINMRKAREIGIEVPLVAQHNATRIIK